MLARDLLYIFYRLMAKGERTMKIDPNNPLNGIPVPPHAPSPVKGADRDFSEVFNASIASGKDHVKATLAEGASAMPPSMKVQPRIQASEIAEASRLIGAMERYHELLSDPSVNLKMLAPEVERLGQAARTAEQALRQLPEANPLKSIVSESVAMVQQEIERFASGLYVID
jgi:hypothetical protein